MAVDQPGLFDAEGLVADVGLTLGDSPIARPARVGFLGGLIAVWAFGSSPTTAQKDRALEFARETLDRADKALA